MEWWKIVRVAQSKANGNSWYDYSQYKVKSHKIAQILMHLEVFVEVHSNCTDFSNVLIKFCKLRRVVG